MVVFFLIQRCHWTSQIVYVRGITDLKDLSYAPFNKVEYVEDPIDALKIWYNLFNEILNKHAPIVTKRVKRGKQPEWYNTEVQYARQIRDKFKNINSGEIEQSKY